LLVPSDDPPALAAALTRLLHDPEEAARLGRVGEQRLAAEASWAEVAARVVPLYQELVDARRDRNHHA
jgi:alpha-maltose-1-phosphate synthase